ncbi:hypothetical protein OTU49_000712, partial [Cherax quadricarinatus]
NYLPQTHAPSPVPGSSTSSHRRGVGSPAGDGGGVVHGVVAVPYHVSLGGHDQEYWWTQHSLPLRLGLTHGHHLPRTHQKPLRKGAGGMVAGILLRDQLSVQVLTGR